MAIRVLIADDHILLRAGLRALLNTSDDFKVIGEASDGTEALKLAAELKPDVVLMDMNMPGCGGMEATHLLRQKHPDINVLILTVHEDKSLLQEALRVGASGYILKRALESELVNSLKAVARGDMYVHPAMTRALLSSAEENDEGRQNSIDVLTPREVEVLRLLANGHTNRQIADILAISVRTVESHRSNLMNKLNFHSRSELVRFAADHDLLQVEDN
ncbi:MAG: response regulator transcription factor [Ardenticatenaceae bacterium]|nr:response regulator transcription factor [Ardenticatenaceae bacterium]MCB9445203.1 response regulator transcription factor [Ardenticatenaceae bacterium]